MNNRRLLSSILLTFALLIIAFNGVSLASPAFHGLTDRNTEVITPTHEKRTYDSYIDNLYTVEPAEVIEPPDEEPPKSSLNVEPPWYDIWYGYSPVEVQFLLKDKSVATGAYRLDSGDWLPYENGTIIEIEGEGIHILEYNATDSAENVEPTNVHYIGIDLTPPEMDLQISGMEGNDDWWLSDLEVTLNATDDYSGLSQFEYTVDFDSYDAFRVGNSFTLETEGEHEIRWIIRDHMGLRLEETVFIRIDKTAPQTEFSYEEDGEGGLIVTLSATDSISGVAQTMYSLDGEEWVIYKDPFEVAASGIVTVYYNSTDLAGNVESTKTEVIEFDSSPPTTTIDVEGSLGLNDWYTSNVTVTLSASDEESGVDTILYSFDEVTWTEYHSPFEISVEGITEIHFCSTDLVGNVEEVQIFTLKIDKTTPQTILTITPTPIGTAPLYISTTSELSLSATDGSSGSGVMKIEYKIDSGDWLSYIDPLHISVIGNHTFAYRSTDYAGNIENEKLVSLIVNATQILYIGDTSGTYSDIAHLRAQLVDVALESPIAGAVVSFELGGVIISAITDSEGFADVSVVIDVAAGDYSLISSFEGNSAYFGSTDAVGFLVTREDAAARYTGQTVASATSETITLRATVIEDEDESLGNISKAYVSFLIFSSSSESVIVFGPYQLNTTDVPGLGVVTVVISNLPEGDYSVVVVFPSDVNEYYTGPDSSPVSITIAEPSRDFITGAGWIMDSEDEWGHFAFFAKYRKSGTPWGHAVYIYQEDDWLFFVKTSKIVGLAILDDHAFFEGTCYIFKVNFKTKQFVWLGNDYYLRIDVWDEGRRGRTDVFQIRIYDSNGMLFHEAGFDPYGQLQRGNIVIHHARRRRFCLWRSIKKRRR
ncbi:Ig-like domain repeat protein [Candidatus Thorarchaeota archaeon]|nr:MAG: Ig-like domain repeat protein [Candidatus Thorarchaeota archaeon]